MEKTFEQRFWNFVDKKSPDECWEWKGYKNRDGYGNFSINKKRWNSHRVSYSIVYGEIPAGVEVCHKCDNPSCVNPGHLFIATHKNNMKDMAEKGRSRVNILSAEQKQTIKNSKKKLAELSKIFCVSVSAIRYHK